jgi:hypothetical protein
MKHIYALLDFGGNIEDEKLMTTDEAKKENDYLWTQERFLQWVNKAML